MNVVSDVGVSLMETVCVCNSDDNKMQYGRIIE